MFTPHSRQSRSVDAFALLALLALSFSAQALKSDRDQQLEIFAKNSRTDEKAKVTVLTGAVKFSQGSVKGDGDKATLNQGEDNQIRRVLLEGRPAHLAQQLDGGGMMNAQATQIDYDAAANTAVLTGDAVVVQQGRGEFRSERIVYNTESGEITGGTDAPGGGVHMIVQPKAKSPDKAADKKPAEKKN
jgi:lipopolysaccharide export system protein LptA